MYLLCSLGNVGCAGHEPLNSAKDSVGLRFIEELQSEKRLTEKVQQKLETSSLLFSDTF